MAAELGGGDAGFGVDDHDPAAEFLAREQDELAGLNDDDVTTTTAQNGPIVNGEAELPAEANGPVGAEDGEVQENGGTGWEAISQVDRLQQEPEKIKVWRKEQQERLEKKDAEEEEKKESLREAARKELEQWYEKQAEQLQKTRVNNRESEKVFLEERDSESPGQEWERIARLCDFNPKTSKHSKDISRMRSIILQLKGQPLVQVVQGRKAV